MRNILTLHTLACPNDGKNLHFEVLGTMRIKHSGVNGCFVYWARCPHCGRDYEVIAPNEPKDEPEARVWRSGPPPHVGWWNASANRGLDAWRWWDGKQWSLFAYSQELSDMAASVAGRPAPECDIKWTHFYPKNARVPRIDPGAAKPVSAKAWALLFPNGTIHPSWLYVTEQSLKDFAPGEVTGEVGSWENLKAAGYGIARVSIEVCAE